MNLRSPFRAAVVLTSALGAIIVAPALAPAAAASANATHATLHSTATSAPWSFIRRACKTVTEGTICVNLEGNGQPSTYRVVYQLIPKTGMRALTQATWFTGSYPDGVGAHAVYRPICSGGVYGCDWVYTPTNYVVSSPYLAVYTMIVQTDQNTTYEVSAGVTPAVASNSEGCGPGGDAGVRAQLTSTSDGSVYWGRSGGTLEYYQVFGLSDATSFHAGSAQPFFHHWARADHAESPTKQQYRSPTFYAAWQRRPDSGGGWTTQHTSAFTEQTDSQFEGPPVC